MMKFYTYIDSPVGILTLTAKDESLTGLYFGKTAFTDQTEGAASPLIQDAVRQLSEYFAGTRVSFDLPLELAGTAFQRAVWAELQKIPYAETRSYADIAKAIGSPKSFRAVGQANHRNPVSIIVPCHRVVTSDGNLGGYGGGVSVKQFLLDLELRVSGSN